MYQEKIQIQSYSTPKYTLRILLYSISRKKEASRIKMPQQTPTSTHRDKIRIDISKHSSQSPSSTTNSRTLTPMQRWKTETDGQQPWNALASFTQVAGWKEQVAEQGQTSTKGQNGSVWTNAE